jgi:hypothetical protein
MTSQQADQMIQLLTDQNAKIDLLLSGLDALPWTVALILFLLSVYLGFRLVKG